MRYLLFNKEICKKAAQLRLELLEFGGAMVGPEWSGARTTPLYSRLYYVVNGNAEITTYDGHSMRFAPGKWYLLPAGCSFFYRCAEEMEHIFFHVKLCGYDGTDLLRCCPAPLCLDAENDPYLQLKDCLYSQDINHAMQVQQILHEILSSIVDHYHIQLPDEHFSPCVMRAIQFIRQNLSARLTVSEIAENAQVSKSTITKCFQKELSMSIKEYLFDLIFSEAECQLRDTKKSILAISEQYGFSDQFYFSRKFKEKFEQSPREYRKNILSRP